MAYQQIELGEFIVGNDDDWPKTVRYIERRPVTGKGVYNPWLLEQQRRIWQAEQEAWKRIQPLMREYALKEKAMKYWIAYYNEHVDELNRVAGKPTGLGPISQYGSMAALVLPGAGKIVSAVFMLSNMIVGMFEGKRKKRRIDELTRLIAKAQRELESLQDQLRTIAEEILHLTQATERAKSVNQADLRKGEIAQKVHVEARKNAEIEKAKDRWKMIQQIRQPSENVIVYDNL